MASSMRAAIQETDRRRTKQDTYNREHNITPIGINKAVKDLTERVRKVAEERGGYKTGTAVGELPIPKDEIVKLLKELEKQMKQAAKDLEFEKAAALRDQVIELRRTMALEGETVKGRSQVHIPFFREGRGWPGACPPPNPQVGISKLMTELSPIRH